jgi:hypothetical protein
MPVRSRQRGQHVGTTAAAGHGAIAVLDHRHAGGRRYQGRRRADVESAAAIAAGAAGIQHIVASGAQGHAILAQYRRRRRQLVGRLALDVQGH